MPCFIQSSDGICAVLSAWASGRPILFCKGYLLYSRSIFEGYILNLRWKPDAWTERLSEWPYQSKCRSKQTKYRSSLFVIRLCYQFCIDSNTTARNRAIAPTLKFSKSSLVDRYNDKLQPFCTLTPKIVQKQDAIILPPECGPDNI